MAPIWLGIVAGGLAAEATSKPVTEIRVVGAARIARETVLARAAIESGAPLDEARTSAIIRALFATGQYQDVRIDQTDDVVTLHLVESPVVDGVAFEGNAGIKPETLAEVLAVRKGTTYSSAKAHKDALALRELYRREGRIATDVMARITEKPHNMVDVTFIVTEGKVAHVSSISFEGNVAIGPRELEGVIRTVRSSWLDIIRSNSIYVADRLTEDQELLRRHYLRHGFAEARIVTAESAPDASGDGYAVRFVIDEGERFAFGDVAIETTLPDVERSALRDLIEARSGETFNAAKVDETVEALSLALWEQGQRFARVVATLKPDRARRLMSVCFHIEDGPHLMVERVEVSGNSRTQVGVILREMNLKEGHAFNSLMLERDKLRISKLGFFKSVRVTSRPGSDKEKVVIAIELEEDETIVLSMGGGYSTAEGVIGDMGVEETNLFGTGRRAKLKLSGSAVRFQAEASVTEPHVLDSNVSASVGVLYKDFDASRQSSYQGRRIGGSVELGYALSDTMSGSVNYKLSRNTITDVGPSASAAIRDAVPGYPDASSTTYTTSSVGYGLSYDTRDKRILPSAGNLMTLTQDFAGAGGDVRYIKSALDARSYIALSEDVTLVGRATAGTISGWGGEDVRLLDMFYLGNEMVRGFASAGIGPRDMASANKDALGGRHYIATTAEMRFGLPGVPDDIGLKGAVFADAGSLFGTSSAAARTPGLVGNDASIRTSVGAGLIWDSPLGPLRADYAVPLTSTASDKTQPLSFGLAGF